jgi:integrase
MALKFTRLTRPDIRRLKKGEKVTEHGITAERMAGDDVRYSVNIMVDGQRIHRVIGRASEGVTRSQAEEFIAKVRTEAREDRLSLPKGRKTPLKFNRAADIYIANEKEVSAKDVETKERHLKLHLRPYFGNMLIDKITEFTVEKFRNELRKKEFAEGGINRILATYRHMGNRLSKERVIPVPLPFIKLKYVENRREDILSLEDENALLAAALNNSNAYIWLFIKIGLSTGLRHREILSARFDGFDPARKRLRVLVKGGKIREQPLTSELVKIISRERDMAANQDGWIFPNPAGKSGHYDSMKKPFRRVVIAAGLNPTLITPHTMRHTAITNFAETGADLRTVQKFSGHETMQMVMRYTHARDERVDQALEKMQRAKTKPEQIGSKSANDS